MPKGLRLIEQLAPKHTRYLYAIKKDYFSNREMDKKLDKILGIWKMKIIAAFMYHSNIAVVYENGDIYVFAIDNTWHLLTKGPLTYGE